MGLVNPTQVVSGNEIKASDVNTPVNQLANVINGNIESVNIKDGGIGANKLGTGAVNLTSQIADRVITSDQIADRTITEGKLNLSYSTDEKITGEKWIDGRDIYKKTVTLGAMPNVSSKDIPHNIINLGYLIRCDGTMNNGTSYYPLPSVSASSFVNQIQISVNEISISITTTGGWSNWSGTVTLYYTKTN